MNTPTEYELLVRHLIGKASSLRGQIAKLTDELADIEKAALAVQDAARYDKLRNMSTTLLCREMQAYYLTTQGPGGDDTTKGFDAWVDGLKLS